MSQMMIFAASLPSSLMLPLQQTLPLIFHHQLRCVVRRRHGSNLQGGFLDAVILADNSLTFCSAFFPRSPTLAASTGFLCNIQLLRCMFSFLDVMTVVPESQVLLQQIQPADT